MVSGHLRYGWNPSRVHLRLRIRRVTSLLLVLKPGTVLSVNDLALVWKKLGDPEKIRHSCEYCRWNLPLNTRVTVTGSGLETLPKLTLGRDFVHEQQPLLVFNTMLLLANTHSNNAIDFASEIELTRWKSQADKKTVFKRRRWAGKLCVAPAKVTSLKPIPGREVFYKIFRSPIPSLHFLQK